MNANHGDMKKYLNPSISGARTGTSILDLKNKGKNRKDSDHSNIEKLQNDINKDLDNLDTGTEKTVRTEKHIEESKEMSFLTESFVLLLIYITMSQSFFQKMVKKYIPFTESEGSVGLIGVVIFGVILVALFMTIRKIIVLTL